MFNASVNGAEIHNVTKRGDIQTVKRLISEGIDLSVQDNSEPKDVSKQEKPSFYIIRQILLKNLGPCRLLTGFLVFFQNVHKQEYHHQNECERSPRYYCKVVFVKLTFMSF